MNSNIIMALISLVGTLFGSMAGILTAGKLTNYRIGELEKKVDGQYESLKIIPLLEKEQQIQNVRIKALETKYEKIPLYAN